MKQFKGGLYANLGNYKSSLPQTKILNNFFNQNPVGYKKGGEVKGIKGVNYSRIPVTGGFMANAQGYKKGGFISSYYGKKGDAIAPGRLESQAVGPLFVYEPGLPYGKGPDLKDPDFGKIVTKEQAKDAGYFFDKFGNPSFAPFTDLRRGDPSADKSALQGIRFPEEKQTPMEFTDSKSEYLASSAKKVIDDQKQKRLDNIAEMNKTTREAYDEMFGEDFGIGGGINSLLDFKKKKSKLKNADDIVSEGVTADFKTETEGKTESSLQRTDKDRDTSVEVPDIMSKLEEKGVFDTKDSETLFGEMFDGDKFNKILNKQEELTKSSIDAINKIGKPFYDKDGEDAPEWAMPLMMAGLKMAASNNPSLLGALAEGGISGMEEYAKKQAQKREDAKDQINLEMQKMNAIINLQSKDIDVATDFAKLESNTKTEAFKIAYDDYASTKESIRNAILKETELKIGTQEFEIATQQAYEQLDQNLDIAIAQLEKDYAAMQDRRDEFKTDLEYKNKLLEIESVKIYNENIKHQNLLELEKVSEGKITTVLMPDDDGNMKEFKIRTYYDYDTEQYENDIIGFAPPDSDYLENLENEIRNQIATGVYEELEGKTLEEIESFISNLVQQKINAEFGDIKATETGAGG